MDAFLTTVDAALRTLFVTPHASQPCPTLPEQTTELSAAEKKQAGALIRPAMQVTDLIDADT